MQKVAARKNFTLSQELKREAEIDEAGGFDGLAVADEGFEAPFLDGIFRGPLKKRRATRLLYLCNVAVLIDRYVDANDTGRPHVLCGNWIQRLLLSCCVVDQRSDIHRSGRFRCVSCVSRSIRFFGCVCGFGLTIADDHGFGGLCVARDSVCRVGSRVIAGVSRGRSG